MEVFRKRTVENTVAKPASIEEFLCGISDSFDKANKIACCEMQPGR